MEGICENHASYVLGMVDKHQAEQYQEYMSYLEQVCACVCRAMLCHALRFCPSHRPLEGIE